jgi:hypothetical protein
MVSRRASSRNTKLQYDRKACFSRLCRRVTDEAHYSLS